MTPRIVIQIRVSRAEKRAMQRAAKRAGMSVTDWLRWSSEMQEIRVEMLKNQIKKERARP